MRNDLKKEQNTVANSIKQIQKKFGNMSTLKLNTLKK